VILAVASLVMALTVGSFDDDTHVNAGSDDFNTSIETTDLGSQDHHVTTTTDSGGKPPVRDSDLDAICVSTAITIGEDPFAFCDILPTDDVEITPGMVAAALARVPVPASKIEVQPANGRTLVNFDTNFFTGTRAFDVPLTLLGQRVELHIVPSEFGWRFGDGEFLATADPGAPYPDLDVIHRYLTKGKVAPSVDTTYTAEFRVNGGRWRDVPGSVTIVGAPVDLQVLTATPTLVGYDRG
jgi:hypothetical protein